MRKLKDVTDSLAQTECLESEARNRCVEQSRRPQPKPPATDELAFHGESSLGSPSDYAVASPVAHHEQGSTWESTRLFIKQHEALYRSGEIGPYSDNVCVRAMPELLADKDIYAQLAHVPAKRDPEFFALPAHVRRDAVHDIAELFVPTVENVENFGLLQVALRRSYQHRHPGNRETMMFLNALAAVDADNVTQANSRYLPRPSRSGGGSMGILISGAPGCGKTTLFDRFEAYFDKSRVIFHTSLAGRPCLWPQVPIVRVQVPETKTVKALAGAIIAQIDALTGSALHATLAYGRNPAYFLVRTAQIASSYMVGLVVVEDLQHLATARGDATPLLNWLGSFMELTGIPVVTIATHKVRHVIRSDSGIGSKLTSGGTLTVDYLPLGTDYQRLLQASWSLRVSHADLNMPAELPAICHKHTAGNRRYTREFLLSLFTAMTRIKNGDPITTAYIEQHARLVLRDKRLTVSAVHKWKNALPLTASERQKFVEYIDASESEQASRPPGLP